MNGTLAAIHAPKGHPSRRVFWDVEHREPDVNSRPMLTEERLWAAVLVKAIQDSKGVSSDNDEECLECHQEKHPSCFRELERGGKPYILRANKKCTDHHTIRECATSWINSDAQDDTDRGRSFIGLCDLLGLEPTYLRRNLASQEANEYWRDEAKINSFLGFHTGVEPSPCWEEASRDTGCSSEAGDTD